MATVLALQELVQENEHIRVISDKDTGWNIVLTAQVAEQL
jgi:hypothetical protein